MTSLPESGITFSEQLSSQVDHFKKVIQDILLTQAPVCSGWSSRGGAGCIDFSKQLIEELRKRGEKVKVVVGRGHVSLVNDDFGVEHRVIIDPSYSQFFDFHESLGMPPILVGTFPEITEILTKYREWGIKELQEEHGPEQFVKDHYQDTKPFVFEK